MSLIVLPNIIMIYKKIKKLSKNLDKKLKNN